MSLKFLHRITVLSSAIIIAASGAMALPPQQQPRWEQVESVEAEMTDDVSVAVRDNCIYVTVSRPTTVKLFTILGQPISQVSLQPGTSRFRVGARGIYILKIGSITRRITI